MERYSKINTKRKREIVLLRGNGCIYKKCRFCDYYLDQSNNLEENYLLNKEVLSHVCGEFGELEVINSGSVFELDLKTLQLIKKICQERKIHTLHFETHYLYKEKLSTIKEFFPNITIKFKLGLETFDNHIREDILNKGIQTLNLNELSSFFQEANFLFGITGQSVKSMQNDITLGLKYFERICINIMCENTTSIKPDKQIIHDFLKILYPLYKEHPRIDILIDKKDFGVGD